MTIIKVHVAVIITLIVRCDILLTSKDPWPSGSYSLPKPKSGCPNSWKEGWLRQDLEDDAISSKNFRSKFSSIFNMNATIVKKEYVERTFCTKVANKSDTQEQNPWLKGSYCIYRKQSSCPDDMVGGSILWDDEDENNGNDQKGNLPDLNSGDNTKLYFCCQNQGKWYTSIELPTEEPFYLLPYGSRNCQRVMGAVSSLEYIIYDTEDDFNGDDFEGHHAFTDKVESLPKIYYCYYEGCQYMFQNGDGAFASPNYINSSYPDFQYCSWSITVNVSLRISLEFLTLNVPNCEENSLVIYDGRGDNASTLLARFCGANATSGAKVTSRTNHLHIVLKSGNNSARNEKDSLKRMGFYAEYETFLPETTTTFVDKGRNDLQNTNSGNSPIYLTIVLPILAILILFGVVGAILYWKRRHKERDADTQVEQKQNQPTVEGPDVAVKTTTNPIYGSEVNSACENDTEMKEATDNFLYEPGNELFEVNPIYQGIDDNDVDPTYAIPTK